MPYKPCRGCGTLTQESICTKCKSARENHRTTRRATEEPWRAIYGTQQWKDTQRLVIARDGHCKAIVNGAECGTTQALTAHHIVALSEDQSRAFDLNNLICLCLRHNLELDRQRRDST